MPISPSISFACFVSSIETLVDHLHKGVKIEKCKECSAPRYAVTRKFTDFLKKYSSESDELIRFYKQSYSQRSKILHAGALFTGEHIPVEWAESDWEAYHMNSGIERICRIAFTNWILEKHRFPLSPWIMVFDWTSGADQGVEIVDCVEKVDPAWPAIHWAVKTPFFARCYVKFEPKSFCAKHRFQSQTRTFQPWQPKPTFSTESVDCSPSLQAAFGHFRSIGASWLIAIKLKPVIVDDEPWVGRKLTHSGRKPPNLTKSE